MDGTDLHTTRLFNSLVCSLSFETALNFSRFHAVKCCQQSRKINGYKNKDDAHGADVLLMVFVLGRM